MPGVMSMGPKCCMLDSHGLSNSHTPHDPSAATFPYIRYTAIERTDRSLLTVCQSGGRANLLLLLLLLFADPSRLDGEKPLDPFF